MPTFFLNGKFFTDSDPPPVLSALDAGLQHGVGLFETLLAGTNNGKPWALHLDEHLERLATSAKALNLSDQLRTAALGDVLLETVKRSNLERARVRLTITGGDLNLLSRARDPGSPAAAPAQHDPTILIVAQPATTYPRQMLDHGVAATIADTRANPLDPFTSHKTLNYWWRLRELQNAGGKNAAEALVFTVSNHLASGCVSNAFLVKNNKLLTPIARGEEEQVGKENSTPAGNHAPQSPGLILPSPVLPGITRQWAIDTAAGLGALCTRRMLTISDVLSADELFLTNSSWGVLPVVRVEAETIGAGGGGAAGEPGPITKQLITAWDRAIADAADLA